MSYFQKKDTADFGVYQLHRLAGVKHILTSLFVIVYSVFDRVRQIVVKCNGRQEHNVVGVVDVGLVGQTKYVNRFCFNQRLSNIYLFKVEMI